MPNLPLGSRTATPTPSLLCSGVILPLFLRRSRAPRAPLIAEKQGKPVLILANSFRATSAARAARAFIKKKGGVKKLGRERLGVPLREPNGRIGMSAMMQ